LSQTNESATVPVLQKNFRTKQGLPVPTPSSPRLLLLYAPFLPAFGPHLDYYAAPLVQPGKSEIKPPCSRTLKKLSNLYLYINYLIIYNLYLIINRQNFILFFSSIYFVCLSSSNYESFFYLDMALFTFQIFCKIGIVAFSFVFDKYCPIMN